MTVNLLTQWWNLAFLVPLGLSLLYLGVYATSGWTFGDSDFDHDVDGDFGGDLHADADLHADVDADADVHADVDADADGDVSHDADHDADGDADGGGSGAPVWLTIVSWLGVGRVPVSIILMVLGLTWGVIGFGANQIVGGATPWPVSLPLAAVGSVLITKGVSTVVRRVLPMNETYAKPRHNLLGTTGEAMYPIDETFGMVSVRDPRGDLFQVPCRVAKGREPIPKGSHVYLSGYSEKEQMFFGEAV